VTWGDQHVFANGEKTRTYRETETNLSEETVRRWVEIIDKFKLPLKTITIDGYWCRQIGNWVADETRFPNMRYLVDELHKKGYKVIFWYCPFEAEKTSDIFKTHPEYFLEENSKDELFLEKDVQLEARPRYDYTRPQVREFIKEDIRRMLSSEKGCYDGDGLKLDFYGNAPNALNVRKFFDPTWGIGHRFVLNAHASIYAWAKKYKADCRVDGENGNPFFADYTDSMRAWDWCEPDYTPYNDRVKLAGIICPGVPALYDEHIYFKDLYKYCIRAAVARPIFFNVECFHGDMHKPTVEEYKTLSDILHIVQDLNRRASDVKPENIDKGTIFDWEGNLIGKVAKDDTVLVSRNDNIFDIVLLNDEPRKLVKGVVIDPMEFGLKRKPFMIKAEIPGMGVCVRHHRI
jgi:hypothetical protein